MRRKYTKGSSSAEQKENIENQASYEEEEDSIAVGIPIIKVNKILKESAVTTTTTTPSTATKSKRSINYLFYLFKY